MMATTFLNIILNLAILIYLVGCTSSVVNDYGNNVYGSVSPTITVKPSEDFLLLEIISDADPGTTILLEDGRYRIDRHLQIRQKNITIRSKSGNREAVIIDGQYRGYLIHISAPYATIANLTIMRAKYHLVHIVGNGHYATLDNLHLIDARQQFVKANPSGGNYCDHGTVRHCLFELTAEGRDQIDPIYGGCYSGGVDVLAAQGWRVMENRFENIYCTNGGLPTHMVLFWKTSRDPIVEANTIINCARGIGFGLTEKGGHRNYPDLPGYSGQANPPGHFGGMIRKNIIFSNIGKFCDTGIGLEQAQDVTVMDNVVFTDGGGFSAIDIRFPRSNAVVKNNWVNHRITVRDGAMPVIEGNSLIRQDVKNVESFKSQKTNHRTTESNEYTEPQKYEKNE